MGVVINFEVSGLGGGIVDSRWWDAGICPLDHAGVGGFIMCDGLSGKCGGLGGGVWCIGDEWWLLLFVFFDF